MSTTDSIENEIRINHRKIKHNGWHLQLKILSNLSVINLCVEPSLSFHSHVLLSNNISIYVTLNRILVALQCLKWIA